MPIFALEDPIFQPAMRIISNITNASEAVITTTFDHDYFTGDIVRIIIPRGFGMQQINNQTGAITVLSPTMFSIAINTLTYDVFSIPAELPGHYYTKAHVVPIGEVNSTLRGATINTLPTRVR